MKTSLHENSLDAMLQFSPLCVAFRSEQNMQTSSRANPTGLAEMTCLSHAVEFYSRDYQ